MRTSEIIEQLESKRALLIETQLKAYELGKEINHLDEQARKSQIKHFFEYLQLGTSYTFQTFIYLKGAQIASKDSFKPSPYFSPGDVIEWDRRNAKSIVVKQTKKVNYMYNPNNFIQEMTSESNTDTYYRLEIEPLFNFMMSDPLFKAGLDAYIMRVESLEELGI
jgi:hypothetical protein